MQDLLQLIDNEPRVSHRIVAQNTANNQKHINELIRKYESDFGEFGMVPFKTEAVSEEKLKLNPDAKAIKTYYLNEPQATFLMTLLRNKPVVVEFKKKLVKAFYKMKDTSQNIESTNHLTLISEMLVNFMSNQQKQNEMMLKQVTLLTELVKDVKQTQVKQVPAKPVYEHKTLTTSQMDKLKIAISKAAVDVADYHKLSISTATRVLYGELNGRMGVSTYYQILGADFYKAMLFIRNAGEKARLEQENINDILANEASNIQDEYYDEEAEEE